MVTISAENISVRALTAADLDAVTAIDRLRAGHGRRHFFEKRFIAERQWPDNFVHVGVEVGGKLKGFAIARVLRGEHGYTDMTAVVDALGVERDSRRHGLGRALIMEMIKVSRGRGVGPIQSQVHWDDPDLLQFFHATGFVLAPRLALQRPVADLIEPASEEE
jgi:GNAT superfamily N-acetyltransferase